MPQKIIKSSKQIVQEAFDSVPKIDVNEAISLLESKKHQFVDLRDYEEVKAKGQIPNALLSSRGMMEFHLDPESPAHKSEFNQDKIFIFYCATGGRSALAAKVAIEMGLKTVLNLTGGFSSWKKAGGKTSNL